LISRDDIKEEISELEFLAACVKWARNRENPRESLGDVLGDVRFLRLTSEEFATHVIPTKLLTPTEEREILFCIATGNARTMPPGFSNEKKTRRALQTLSHN
jgi:hypothetical protein